MWAPTLLATALLATAVHSATVENELPEAR